MNPIFDFDYQVNGQNCQMVVTSVSGHMIEMMFPKEYKNWQHPPPTELFSAPIIRSVPDVR